MPRTIEPGDVLIGVEPAFHYDPANHDLLGPEDTPLGVPVRLRARFESDEAREADLWQRGEEEAALVFLDELSEEAAEKVHAFIARKYDVDGR
jgi:hypothetical protein